MTREEAVELILEAMDNDSVDLSNYAPGEAGAIFDKGGDLYGASVAFQYDGGDREEMGVEAIETAAMSIRFLMNLYKF